MARERYDLRHYEQQRKNRLKNRVSISAHAPEVTRGHFWSRFRLRRESKSDPRSNDVERAHKSTIEPRSRTAELAILMLQRERLPILQSQSYSNEAIIQRAMRTLTPDAKIILQMALGGDTRGFRLAESAWMLYQKTLDTPRHRTDAAFATMNGLRYPGEAVGWAIPASHSYFVGNMEFNSLERFRVEHSRQRFASPPSARMVVCYRGERNYVRV